MCADVLFHAMSPFLQVSRMFYEWREALKVARKQTQLIDGQMVNHNRRVKQGCMGQWKKFTLKSRADKHCNKTVTAKVRSGCCLFSLCKLLFGLFAYFILVSKTS